MLSELLLSPNIPAAREGFGQPVPQIKAGVLSIRTWVCSTELLHHNRSGINVLVDVPMCLDIKIGPIYGPLATVLLTPDISSYLNKGPGHLP